MKLFLAPLYFAAGIIAAPAPQMDGHSHGTSPAPGKGLGELAGLAPAALAAMAKMLPPLPLFKKESAQPVSKRQGVIREQLYYGPITLKSVAEKLKEKPGLMAALQMDPQGNVFFNSINEFPKDISLLRSETYIRDANGKDLGISQGIYNHHISVPDISRPTKQLMQCPNKSGADMAVNSIAGVGEDGGRKIFTAETGSDLSAYYVGPNDSIGFVAEIINNSNTTQNVYAVLDVEYLKEKPVLTSTYHVLSVGTCDGQSIGINPTAGQKKFVITSKPMTVQKDGYIFGVRGHLHDGGVDVLLKNNGKVVCESKAMYGGGNKVAGAWETISSMGSCAETTPIQVKKGDNLTLETAYDFELHPARKHGDGMMAEAMGMALFSFASRF